MVFSCIAPAEKNMSRSMSNLIVCVCQTPGSICLLKWYSCIALSLMINSLVNWAGRELETTGEGVIPQKITKEVVDGVGKPSAWSGGSRRDRVIKKTELKSNLFEHGHVSLYWGIGMCRCLSETPLH